MTIQVGEGRSETVYVQTEPAFSTAPPAGPELLRRIESRSYESWRYNTGTPLMVVVLPTDGLLVVNGRPMERPSTIHFGDLVAWFPGEVVAISG